MKRIVMASVILAVALSPVVGLAETTTNYIIADYTIPEAVQAANEEDF